jgi:hypothetical protein
MQHWFWAGASCQGVSHKQTETRRQDNFSAFTAGDCDQFLVAIASDGAGSANHGGEGATLTCRIFAVRIRSHFTSSTEFPTEGQLWAWLDELRDMIAVAADKRNLTRRDFAATLVCAITDGNVLLTAHVGDGCVVVRDYESLQWQAASWPDQGEYASTTFFVTDDPEPRMRVARREKPVSAIAVFTDGIERVALDLSSQAAHQPFFKGIIQPLDQLMKAGVDRDLSRKLGTYLDSPAINERTEDDKTLILAVRK